MNNVFGVYGINVSSRHLTLVADYMTFTGKIAPFSRAAMASSSSPLQKMTFETTMAFMRETLQNGMFFVCFFWLNNEPVLNFETFENIFGVFLFFEIMRI